MKRYLGTLVTILFLCFGFYASYTVTTHVVTGDTEPVFQSPFCNLIERNTDVPEGFGSPVYQHGYNKGRTMMNVYCIDSGAFLAVGNGHPSLLVYRYGYEWADGSWKQIEFWGELMNEAWLKGAGLVQLSTQGADYRSTNSVVAYTCTDVRGTYQCGCKDKACEKSYWQLQQYGTDEPIVIMPTVPAQQPDIMESAGAYRPDTVYVNAVKPRVAAQGERILIAGANFDFENNTLHFGDQKIQGVPAPTGGAIEFTLPKTIKPGWYDLYVSNSLGKSVYGSHVVVTEPGADAPTIRDITPGEVAPGQEITLRGEGFTKENNVIVSTFKVIPGIPSEDGHTLTLPYDPFVIPEEYQHYFEGKPLQNIDPVTYEPDPVSWPIALWVANGNGESNKVELILTY